MEPFSDIDCMTIERFYSRFMKSNGDPKNSFVILGLWTVNIKNRIKFLTDDPQNKQRQFLVVRGMTHKRRRPMSTRFVVGSITDSLARRNIKEWEFSWLGETWR